jgi:hypothetical protein
LHYLKKELTRVVKYAEGLGVKVVFTKRADQYASAEWLTDGSQITFYNCEKKGPLRLLLEFYHELAHHLSWVHNGRKTDFKTDQALYREDAKKAGEVLEKKYRKIIYESERNDSLFQEIIHKEINSKIPLGTLKAERDLDVWIYHRYYITGKYPKFKDVTKKRKQLRRKYGV